MDGFSAKVHCLTNPVTMQEVVNVLLAAGGSAIMAQDPAEVEEITAFCDATLLNTGVPDAEKFRSCILAGKRADALGHPVILDPVGVGASAFRKQELQKLLSEVPVSLIRCNQEEACTLLHMRMGHPGGVESAVRFGQGRQTEIAEKLAKTYDCTVLVSGETDVVSDGRWSVQICGGDARIARITGSGCMLSALCALLCGAGLPAWEAACRAAKIWKKSAERAGIRTEESHGGIGSFRIFLFDEVDRLCHGREETE
ncbi:MAG: hydroxyethylthiazole kinase [Eubacteriales bacterium]|nr:hydroxyethylthiazole kinase [Eubacteriales bacterium]